MASCPRLHPQRSFCSRAVLPCSSDGVAGGPFSFAAKEIRIGRGRPLLPWTLQAGHSSLLQRRLESDAEDRCRHGRCRRNHSSSLQRRLESAADFVAATTVVGGPFSFAATKNRIGRGIRCRYDRCWRAIPHCCDDGAAVIRKSGPEIKNHCTLEGVSRQKPAVIPKFTPSNQESLQCKRRFQAKTCSDS